MPKMHVVTFKIPNPNSKLLQQENVCYYFKKITKRGEREKEVFQFRVNTH